MLRSSTHEEYQAFVKEPLLKQLVNTGQRLVLYTYAELIREMWLTDLTPVASLVAPCYSSLLAKRRHGIRYASSLLLMHLAGYTSITKWIQSLRSFPFSLS